MTCRYSPQYSLLLPTARAAGTRKVDNADSLAGIGNGHRAPDSIQLESRGKYEGMVEHRAPTFFKERPGDERSQAEC